MKFNFKKIIDIKTHEDLAKFKLDKPIFLNNYLFHYLIIFDKLDILKLDKFPIYIENEEQMNGFLLAAKYNNIRILKYLINTYPEYIYNKNDDDETFIDYLEYEQILKLLKYKLDWKILLDNKIDELYYNLNYEELLTLFKYYKPKDHYLHMIIENENLNTNQIIKILNMFDNEIHIRDEDKTIIFTAIMRKDIKLMEYIIYRKVDINYYCTITTIHPLILANAISFYEGYNLIWEHIKMDFDYTLTNNKVENIAYYLLAKGASDKVSLSILSKIPSKAWNQKNVKKITPIDLLINYDFKKYNKLLKNKEIDINNLNKIERITELDTVKPERLDNYKKWYAYLKLLPEYKNNIDIKIENYEYTHANIFQAEIQNMCYYMLYIKNKY